MIRLTKGMVLPALLIFSGCFFSNEERAGGEDFPNTLGTIVASNLNETSGWNMLDSVSTAIPDAGLDKSSNTQLNKVALPKPGPLPKLTAPAPAPLPLTVDSVKIDTLGNLVYVYSWKSDVGIAVQETSVVLFDQIYLDSGLERANYRRVSALTLGALNQPLNYLIIEDADGDSIINAKPNRLNRSKSTIFDYNFLGTTITAITEVVSDAGPDEDFGADGNSATLDNLIVSTRVIQLYPGGDTSQTLQWTDGDGDGFISPDPGLPSNTVEFVVKTFLLGTITTDSFVIGAGPDNDFNTEANNPVHFISSILQSSLGDTLKWTEVLDYDGDGVLYDSLMDSTIVQLRIMENLFPNLLFPPMKEAAITLVIFPRDTTKNYPIKFYEGTFWNNGSAETGQITGPQSDSTFSSGDTLDILVDWIGAASDSATLKKISIRAGLGPDPVLNEDNEMYSLNIQSHFRFGGHHFVELSLLPDTPMKDGGEFQNGTITGMVVFASSDTILVSARVSLQSIQAEITLPDEKTLSVEWDLNGNPL